MRFFYLEDIRKSYHFLQFIYFDENESSNELFIYNTKIRDSDEYLMSLKQAFPEQRFVSIDEFQLEEAKGSELFLNHTLYSKEGIEFIRSLNCSKITMFLGNNVGIIEHDKSALLISPDEYILWNEAFIFHLLEHRQSKLLNEKHKFRVINFVTSNILFQHEKIDVLVFAPTRLCFETEHDITIFLLNLNRALGEIEKSSNVYFKPHQGVKDNYLESSKKIYQCISAVMSFLSVKQLQRFARLFEKRKQ